MKIAPTPANKRRKPNAMSNDILKREFLAQQTALRVRKLPDTSPYTMIDEGSDIAMLGESWCVINRHNRFDKDHDDNVKEYVDCITTLYTGGGSSGRKLILRVNNAFHYSGLNESLLPAHQVQNAGHEVDSSLMIYGNKQHITLKNGSQILLYTDGKQSYFRTEHPIKKDLKTLPKVDLTSRLPYNPKHYILNHALDLAKKACLSDDKPKQSTTSADVPRNVMSLQPIKLDSGLVENEACANMEKMCRRQRLRSLYEASSYMWKPHQLAEWQKRLGNATVETVKKTFLATTQLVPSVRHENELYPKDHHVPRFPLLSCRRLRETVCSDIVYLRPQKKSPAILFYCETSKLLAIYDLNNTMTSASCLNVLYEFIRDFGCPQELRSDYANQMANGTAWKRLTARLLTKITASEPFKHNQNTVERAWQDLQNKGEFTITTMNVPKERTFAMYKHLCDVHNHTARASLQWRTPMEHSQGETPDISVFRYYFWEPIWFLRGPAQQPNRKWVKGRFMGVAWNTGDAMTYVVCPDGHLDKELGNRAVHRSVVIARDPNEKQPHELLKHRSDYFFPTPKYMSPKPLPSKGRKRTAGQMKEISEHTRPTTQGETHDTEPAACPDDKNLGPIEKALRQEYLETAQENDKLLEQLATPPSDILDMGNATTIKSHRWMGRAPNKKLVFTIDTESGMAAQKVELADLQEDCPLLTARYILDTKSLCPKKGKDQPELKKLWTWAKKTIKAAEKINQLAKRMSRRLGIKINGPVSKNAPNSRSKRARVNCRRTVIASKTKGKLKKSNSPNKRKSNAMGGYKYGVWVPRTVKEALEVDRKNGNHLWRDAIIKEIEALQQFKTFKRVAKEVIMGQKHKYQFAPLRIIFDVKQDLQRKARMVIGGHVVDTGMHDTYASNMKTISARLLMIIAAANRMKVLTGDIKNAYLNASNCLSVYVKMGEEFRIHDPTVVPGEFATVEANLYGLGTAAKQWHAHLADSLRGLGFKPSRHDMDVWIRRSATKDGGLEYVGTHTDDLMVVSHEPNSIMEKLQAKYEINKIGPPSFHLGCDYKQDENGDWYQGTVTYSKECIKKVEAILTKTLGTDNTPHKANWKPELDDTNLVDTKGHRNYQQLIGIAQWLITCGRIDLVQAVNSLSRFSAAPREGHLKAAERMFRYVKANPERWIKMDPKAHKPHGELEDPVAGKLVEWQDQYDTEEEMDTKYPESNGTKELSTTVYFDSNHGHDEMTRRSVTGILVYVGNCPVHSISKRQGAIATSTFSAELCAAKVGVEEAINIRCMLRSLGVPVSKPTTLIGDNLGSLISTTNPGTLCKKKTSHISYHFVREANAKAIVSIRKIKTDYNLSDNFTKPLDGGTFTSHMNMIFSKAP